MVIISIQWMIVVFKLAFTSTNCSSLRKAVCGTQIFGLIPQDEIL